nr:DNA mismatch repair protein MSH6 [Tanacetum cinerariifolium]
MEREANGRNLSKVVLYEVASKKQLQEFILVLSGCEAIINACSSLGKDLQGVDAVCRDFKNAYDWAEAKNSGRIIPRDGVDEIYDTACGVINYVTIGKDSYLLEVPESGSLPSDYELQSSKKEEASGNVRVRSFTVRCSTSAASTGSVATGLVPPCPSLYEPEIKQLAIKLVDEYDFVIRPCLIGLTFGSIHRTQLVLIIEASQSREHDKSEPMSYCLTD